MSYDWNKSDARWEIWANGLGFGYNLILRLIVHQNLPGEIVRNCLEEFVFLAWHSSEGQTADEVLTVLEALSCERVKRLEPGGPDELEPHLVERVRAYFSTGWTDQYWPVR
jgi:hypothetical protein